MIVTLRNRKTGEFLTPSGSWAPSGLQAQNFGYSDAAEEVCERLGSPDIHIFYIFNQPQSGSSSQLNHGHA
jgi:hypothetical protein